jgi:regulator of RNase E activity RraA
MSIRATKLNAAGAVLDGFIRDTDEIINLGFPTFSLGSYAADQGVRGKVIDYRVPIILGGVVVNPGDIVFGDRDGIIIVPQQLERSVFEGAIEKSRGEKLVKKALEEGMSSVNAYKKFGIM